MNTKLLLILLGAGLVFSANAQAAILVGTELPDPSGKTSTVASVTALVNAYNTATDPDLPVTGMTQYAKLETGATTSLESGPANFLSLFQFYRQADDDAALNDVENFTVGNVTFDLTTINANDIGDYAVVAFLYTGPSAFDYYTSKNDGGYSLWAYTGGLSPVYTDTDGNQATFDPWINGQGGNSDPNAISNMTFYNADGEVPVPVPTPVPEPASLAAWGLGLAIAGLGARRRRKSS